MQQCNACGGTFEPVLSDGTRYFHACPPLAGHEVRARIADQASPLSVAQTKTLAALDKTPTDDRTGTTGLQLGDAYLAGLGFARPNARDENVDVEKAKAAPKKPDGSLADTVEDAALMKSVGAGVQELADE